MRNSRTGFTLLEMLIVLAVVVAVASIGWPTVRKLAEKSSLKDAARQLRAAMAQTRLDAIESAEVRFLRYQPGTGRFEISRGSPGEDTAELVLLPADRTGSGPPAAAGPGVAGPTVPHELPHGVVFTGPGATEDTPRATALQPVPASGGAWSPPLHFFPNGRTSSAQVRLASPRYRIEVHLRGLTGTVGLGGIQRAGYRSQPPERQAWERLP